jgi:hypothetical protein
VRETLPEETRSPEPPVADDAPAGPLTAPAPQARASSLFGLKRPWSVAAGVCLFVAVVLGWRGHFDGTFVAATLGVVAWFLDQRNLLRARVIETGTDEKEDTELDEQDAP